MKKSRPRLLRRRRRFGRAGQERRSGQKGRANVVGEAVRSKHSHDTRRVGPRWVAGAMLPRRKLRARSTWSAYAESPVKLAVILSARDAPIVERELCGGRASLRRLAARRLRRLAGEPNKVCAIGMANAGGYYHDGTAGPQVRCVRGAGVVKLVRACTESDGCKTW
jgi:hypothetical protein